MPAPVPRRWLLAAVVLASLVAVALWMKGSHGARSERATRSAAEPLEVTPPEAKSPTAPTAEPTPDPSAEKEWRLEVEIRDEEGARIKGRVYVTDVKGDLLSVRNVEPPTPLVQTVRGTVTVIVYAEGYVPRRFEKLTPPPSGKQTLAANMERGPGIEGRVLDDLGSPVTHQRAPRLRIRVSPLDLPPWLSAEPESWRSEWGWFECALWSQPRQDGSFRIDGLPPGRYKIQCDPPHDGSPDRDPSTGPLLQLEPVVATVGDTDVGVVCIRAAEVAVHFVDFDTGEPINNVDIDWSAETEDGELLSGGRGAYRDGVVLHRPPGTSFVLEAEAESYETPEPLRVSVRREPGAQEIELRLRRAAGGLADLELLVRDDAGNPAFPIIIGRGSSSRRYASRDGRYVLPVPAGAQRIELRSPSDQILLFKREWISSMHDPDDFPQARAYLPFDVTVELPRGGRAAKEVTVQRAALIWVRQQPKDAFGAVRLIRGDAEVERALRDLYEHRGLVAAVEPGTYTIEGRTAEDKIVKVEVAAKVAEVAEVWLRAENAK